MLIGSNYIYKSVCEIILRKCLLIYSDFLKIASRLQLIHIFYTVPEKCSSRYRAGRYILTFPIKLHRNKNSIIVNVFIKTTRIFKNPSFLNS